MVGFRSILEAMVTLIIGLAFLPIVTSSAHSSAEGANGTTNAVGHLIPLFPLFYVIGLLILIVAKIYISNKK
jgi:hypothetical protein